MIYIYIETWPSCSKTGGRKYDNTSTASHWPGLCWLPTLPVVTSFTLPPRIPSSCAWSRRTPSVDLTSGFDSVSTCFHMALNEWLHLAVSTGFDGQINVVVGAFFVISGYVAAYTTTTLGQCLGSMAILLDLTALRHMTCGLSILVAVACQVPNLCSWQNFPVFAGEKAPRDWTTRSSP